MYYKSHALIANALVFIYLCGIFNAFFSLRLYKITYNYLIDYILVTVNEY